MGPHFFPDSDLFAILILDLAAINFHLLKVIIIKEIEIEISGWHGYDGTMSGWGKCGVFVLSLCFALSFKIN